MDVELRTKDKQRDAAHCAANFMWVADEQLFAAAVSDIGEGEGAVDGEGDG